MEITASPVQEIAGAFGLMRDLLASVAAEDCVRISLACQSLSERLACNRNEALLERLSTYLSDNEGFARFLTDKYTIEHRFIIVREAGISQPHETALHNRNVPRSKGVPVLLLVDNIDMPSAVCKELSQTVAIDSFFFCSDRQSLLEIAALEKISERVCREELCFQQKTYRVDYFEVGSVPRGSVRNLSTPNVTLISSLFRGKKYIPSFIENLRLSPDFASTDILIFDAAQDLDDLDVLTPYLSAYKNIKYFKLRKDPGLYEIWNLGVHLSRTDIVGNANLDDRRHPLQIGILTRALRARPDVSVCSTHVVPMHDYEGDYTNFLSAAEHVYFSWMSGDYQMGDLFVVKGDEIESHCIPHCMPLWRKDIHVDCGYFNEGAFRSAADYELWLRALQQKKTVSIVPVPASYYYINPNSYMRVDATHESVGRIMHEMYLAKIMAQSPPYYPDFSELLSLIQFRIN